MSKIILNNFTLVYCGLGLLLFITMTNHIPSDWLEWSDEHRMKFHEPRESRRLGGLAAGFFAGLILLIGLDALIPSCIAAASLVVLAVYLAGPNDTLIDAERRFYERTEGWPWRPTTRVGSLDEIAGVCITRVNDVMLLLKHPGRSKPGFYLQAAQTQAAAVVIAENISRITGLPIVEYKGWR